MLMSSTRGVKIMSARGSGIWIGKEKENAEYLIGANEIGLKTGTEIEIEKGKGVLTGIKNEKKTESAKDEGVQGGKFFSGSLEINFNLMFFNSRERKRARRSEDRTENSMAASESNANVTSGDERRKDKEKDRDRDRRRSRSRDHERRKRSRRYVFFKFENSGFKHSNKIISRDRKRSRRSDADGVMASDTNASIMPNDERRREKERIKDKSKDRRERRDRYKDK